jgi:hypothetical protein
VLVVGGGLSGVAAAVAAARRGARVALIEPTHLLGGQMTVAGVGTVDLARGFQTTVENGLWGEIARRIRSVYRGYGLNTAVARYRLHDSMASNPVVTDRVLTELCHEAGVDVLRNCPVVAARITSTGASVHTATGTFTASVAVEATEDGSLLAQADFPYRIGDHQGKGEQVTGKPSLIQRLTQCAVIRRYDGGLPDRLRMKAPPTGYASNNSMIAGGYPGNPMGNSKTRNDFAGLRALPDIADLHDCLATDVADIRRTSLNFLMDVPITTEYLTDPEYRRRAQTEALNKTLAVIYYLQNECDLPWGVAQDEGFREGPSLRTTGVTSEMPEWVVDFPISPYLRESRRLLGAYTLTADRIRRDPKNTSARWTSETLAVGTYGTDLHGGKGRDDFETSLGESGNAVEFTHRGPFPIPAGSFVPTDDRRLVAAEKNLSMSRVASAAVRVQPSVTAVGEAAGVIAALAWKQGVAPRRVSSAAVQISLLKQGALLLPYPISGVSTESPDYPAVALAALHQRVSTHVDDASNLVRLASGEQRAATDIGRRLIHQWEGPL